MKRGSANLRERTGRFVVAAAQSLASAVEQALRDARLKPSQIDSLVLLAARHKCRWCSESPCVCLANTVSKLRPEHHCRAGRSNPGPCRLRSEDIEEVILTDICPYRWALKLTARAFPAFSRQLLKKHHSTRVACRNLLDHAPGTDSITVNVYQGENHKVKNNILLNPSMCR